MRTFISQYPLALSLLRYLSFFAFDLVFKGVTGAIKNDVTSIFALHDSLVVTLEGDLSLIPT